MAHFQNNLISAIGRLHAFEMWLQQQNALCLNVTRVLSFFLVNVVQISFYYPFHAIVEQILYKNKFALKWLNWQKYLLSFKFDRCQWKHVSIKLFLC